MIGRGHKGSRARATSRCRNASSVSSRWARRSPSQWCALPRPGDISRARLSATSACVPIPVGKPQDVSQGRVGLRKVGVERQGATGSFLGLLQGQASTWEEASRSPAAEERRLAPHRPSHTPGPGPWPGRNSRWPRASAPGDGAARQPDLGGTDRKPRTLRSVAPASLPSACGARSELNDRARFSATSV